MLQWLVAGRWGNSGQTSRTLSQSVTTWSKRLRAVGPEVLGGVAGDVDASLGHHLHRVGMQRLGVAARAAGVDGVVGVVLEQRLGHLGSGAVAGAEEQDPWPTPAAGGECHGLWLELECRVQGRGALAEDLAAAGEVHAVVRVAAIEGAAP